METHSIPNIKTPNTKTHNTRTHNTKTTISRPAVLSPQYKVEISSFRGSAPLLYRVQQTRSQPPIEELAVDGFTHVECYCPRCRMIRVRPIS
jgi:hypothetical protein